MIVFVLILDTPLSESINPYSKADFYSRASLFIMRFSATLLSILSLSSAVLAAPVSRRALTAKSYNEFSVSAGVAGDALAEVNTNFPVSSTPSIVDRLY